MPTRWIQRGATRRMPSLIAHARELASKLRAKRLHIRSLMQMQPPFEISTEKVAQHLALSPTVDEQMRRLPSERRNRLKRIEKLGLGVEVGDPTEPVGTRGFLRDLFREYARSRIADAWPPVLQQSRELVSRAAVADSRPQQRPGCRGGAGDEFPRIDDAAVVGCDFRGASGVRHQRAVLEGDTTRRSSPVAILLISGDLHLAQEFSNSSVNGDRRRCSHTGARYIFRRARRRRGSARACRLSAGCGVICRSEWRARWDRDCDGGYQIEFDGGGAIWDREGCGRAVADAPQCVSLHWRDSHSGSDSPQPRVPRDQGARSAGEAACGCSMQARAEAISRCIALGCIRSGRCMESILIDDRVERCRTAAAKPRAAQRQLQPRQPAQSLVRGRDTI